MGEAGQEGGHPARLALVRLESDQRLDPIRKTDFPSQYDLLVIAKRGIWGYAAALMTYSDVSQVCRLALQAADEALAANDRQATLALTRFAYGFLDDLTQAPRSV